VMPEKVYECSTKNGMLRCFVENLSSYHTILADFAVIVRCFVLESRSWNHTPRRADFAGVIMRCFVLEHLSWDHASLADFDI
jgi:hypothetical protein